MLFVGQYETKLEKKSKILLPKSFIQVIEAQNYQGAYVFPSLNGNYLEVVGEAWIAYWARKMENEEDQNSKDHAMTSMIFDHITPVSLEKKGRIALPEHFLSLYGLNSPLMLAGRGYRFLVWNKEAFVQNKFKMQENFYHANMEKSDEASDSEEVFQIKPNKEKL